MAKQEFSSNVIVANEYTLFGNGSIYGTLTVGNTVTEVKIGAEPLENRAVLSIQSDPSNTGDIFIGLDNTVSSTKKALVLNSGQTTQLTLDRTEVVRIFVLATATGQKLNVIEGKV